jgi:hypothetical protein
MRFFCLILLLVIVLVTCGCIDETDDYTPLQDPSTFTASEDNLPQNHEYSTADIIYFKEIALGAEYGSAAKPVVTRWPDKTVLIRVNGNIDENSRTCLNAVIMDFNNLSTTTQLQILEKDRGDIVIDFAPDADFSRLEPNYVPVNRGFFWKWYSNCRITRAHILISTAGDLTHSQRCHLIREELTQSLGLSQDSLRYPDSMFYGGWTDTTRYSIMDETIIRMLYNSGVPFCAQPEEIDSYFKKMS